MDMIFDLSHGSMGISMDEMQMLWMLWVGFAIALIMKLLMHSNLFMHSKIININMFYDWTNIIDHTNKSKKYSIELC